MDKYTLVEKDIEDGKILIRALDEAGFNVRAALWYYFGESEVWRLVIASPVYDKEGPKKAYHQVRSVIKKIEKQRQGFGIFLTNTTVRSPEDELIKSIKSIPTDLEMSGKRFRHSLIDRTYVDDVHIYRSGSI